MRRARFLAFFSRRPQPGVFFVFRACLTRTGLQDRGEQRMKCVNVWREMRMRVRMLVGNGKAALTQKAVMTARSTEMAGP